MKHKIYNNSDKDRPLSICDQNNEVVLSLCKVCGGVESGLTTECPGHLMPMSLADLVSAKILDFKDGKWVHQTVWYPICTMPTDGTFVIVTNGSETKILNQPKGCALGRWHKERDGQWSGAVESLTLPIAWTHCPKVPRRVEFENSDKFTEIIKY